MFGSSSELAVFAVAKRPDGLLGLLVETALRHGHNLTVVGWEFFNQKRRIKRHSKYFLGYKVVALWNIIERCHALNHATDDEHILFLDGTDTVFQAPTSQLCPLLIENSIPSFSVPSETCGRMSFASTIEEDLRTPEVWRMDWPRASSAGMVPSLGQRPFPAKEAVDRSRARKHPPAGWARECLKSV